MADVRCWRICDMRGRQINVRGCSENGHQPIVVYWMLEASRIIQSTKASAARSEVCRRPEFLRRLTYSQSV
jgi:hypothetical protein